MTWPQASFKDIQRAMDSHPRNVELELMKNVPSLGRLVTRQVDVVDHLVGWDELDGEMKISLS